LEEYQNKGFKGWGSAKSINIKDLWAATAVSLEKRRAEKARKQRGLTALSPPEYTQPIYTRLRKMSSKIGKYL
jgi:hypothetical protein